MKKNTTKNMLFLLMLLISFVFVIIFLFWLFTDKKYHIKTEFGDSFTVVDGRSFGGSYSVSDDNSGFLTSVSYFEDKHDFISVCNTKYFKCYQIKNSKVNKYICKIKDQEDLYFTITDSNLAVDIKNKKKWYTSNLLCDENYIRILLPVLDELYHDEMIDIAQKLTAGDYKGLDKYGLTQEMINDKESLDEKIKIMEDYLKNNKE